MTGSPNPYQPAPETGTDTDGAGPQLEPKPRRDWLTHLIGAACFSVGIVSWLVLNWMPTGHPAYGGPSFSRVITVLVTSFVLCLLAIVGVGLRAYQKRTPMSLVYAAPALGYVEYLLLKIVIS